MVCPEQKRTKDKSVLYFLDVGGFNDSCPLFACLPEAS